MDVTIPQLALAHALDRLGRPGWTGIAAERPAEAGAVDETLGFTAAGGQLTVTRVAGEVRLSTALPAQVAAAGNVTVPAALFPYESLVAIQAKAITAQAGITGSRPAGSGPAASGGGRGARGGLRRRELHLSVVLAAGGALALALETASRRVRVSGGGITAGSESHPSSSGSTSASAAPPADAFVVDTGRLRRGLTQVAFAADRAGRRPALGAVLFETGTRHLSLMATDGFRIAHTIVPLADQAGLAAREASAASAEPARIATPLTVVHEVMRLLTDMPPASPVHIAHTASPHPRATVWVGDVDMTFSPVGDAYPDVKRIIPQSWQTRAAVETAELRAAARATTLFGSTKPLLVDARPNLLSLYAPGGAAGAVETGLAAAVEGAPARTVLSADLLLPVLEAATTAHVELELAGPERPIVLREAGKDARALWVIQPMHAPNVLSHRFTA